MIGCGGCEGKGNHKRLCPRHPNYHPWLRLAQMAEEIGDTVGSNDTGIANEAYFLAGRIKKAMGDHPFTLGGRPSEPADQSPRSADE